MEATNYTPLKNPQIQLAWRAPLRPFIKRSKRVMRFYLALALLLSLIIFFLGDRILLLPIWTLLFLFYVLTSTPPPEVESKITRFGVETAGATIRWEALDHFYFLNRFGYEMLAVVAHPPSFYHVYMVVPNPELKKQLIHTLSRHLIYKESPTKTFVDRASDWLSSLVIEEVHPAKTQTPAPTSP